MARRGGGVGWGNWASWEGVWGYSGLAGVKVGERVRFCAVAVARFELRKLWATRRGFERALG